MPAHDHTWCFSYASMRAVAVARADQRQRFGLTQAAPDASDDGKTDEPRLNAREGLLFRVLLWYQSQEASVEAERDARVVERARYAHTDEEDGNEA
jgi:hypothetical protein